MKWALLCCFCFTTLPVIQGVPDDFGQHIAEETVDLGASHSGNDAEEHKKMESLLHWAIENSDPEKLKKDAQRAETESVKEFVEKQKRVRELNDALSAQPTETDMLKTHIERLTATDATEDSLTAALAKLQVLVEPIDNANDLKPLGGIPPLVQLLSHPSLGVQEMAAYVLGTASANNAKFQNVLLEEHPGVVQQLLQLAAATGEAAAGAANKALYALGSLVRTHPQARQAFHSANGLSSILRIMGSPATAGKVKSKAINMVTDLMDLAASESSDVDVSSWDGRMLGQFADAALQLLQASHGDLNRQETALLALRRLLVAAGPAGRDALDEVGAESVLREVLTQLELSGPEVVEEEQLQHEDLFQGQAEQAAGDAKEGFMHLHYVTALCADILHYISIEHEEL